MSDPLTYLDYAATSPLRPEVAEAMAAVLAEPLGNPTGSHPAAQRARRLLEEARDEVADFLGRPAGEIVFTSGGTESANLAVLGPVEAARRAGEESVVLSSAVEHPAVREACRAAAALGADVRELPVDRAGLLDLDALARALSSRIMLVAVMAANNETGVVQPLRAVADAVQQRSPRAVVFADAVQAAPFLDLRELCAGVDLVSVSAHKVGGPVGMGALAVGPQVPLVARQHGGGQERERRSGTQDVVGAVGLATALRLAAAERDTVRAVAERRDRLAGGLLDALPEARRTVPAGVDVLPGHLHLCLEGVEREELLVALGAQGLCVSGGSSCASGALEPSPVLAAMGVPADLAEGAIRFSLGARTTDEDVGRALQIVPAAVASLRVQA
jgi:cysteine desulfurase